MLYDHYIHIDTEVLTLTLAGNFRLAKQQPTIFFHGGLANNRWLSPKLVSYLIRVSSVLTISNNWSAEAELVNQTVSICLLHPYSPASSYTRWIVCASAQCGPISGHLPCRKKEFLDTVLSSARGGRAEATVASVLRVFHLVVEKGKKHHPWSGNIYLCDYMILYNYMYTHCRLIVGHRSGYSYLPD